jgi:hypothetical protein
MIPKRVNVTTNHQYNKEELKCFERRQKMNQNDLSPLERKRLLNHLKLKHKQLNGSVIDCANTLALAVWGRALSCTCRPLTCHKFHSPFN